MGVSLLTLGLIGLSSYNITQAQKDINLLINVNSIVTGKLTQIASLQTDRLIELEHYIHTGHGLKHTPPQYKGRDEFHSPALETETASHTALNTRHLHLQGIIIKDQFDEIHQLISENETIFIKYIDNVENKIFTRLQQLDEKLSDINATIRSISSEGSSLAELNTALEQSKKALLATKIMSSTTHNQLSSFIEQSEEKLLHTVQTTFWIGFGLLLMISAWAIFETRNISNLILHFARNARAIARGDTERTLIKNTEYTETDDLSNALAILQNRNRSYQQITRKQKDLLTKLSASDNLMRLTEKNLKIGHWHYDCEKEQLKWSDEMFHITGKNIISFAPTLSLFFDCFHPEDRAIAENFILTAIRDRTDFDFKLRLQNGSHKYTLIHLIGQSYFSSETGQWLGLTGLCRDISDDHNADQLLEQSKERYRLALHGSAIGLWEWSDHDNKLYWSERVYEVLGKAPQNYTPTVQNIRELLHPDDHKPVLSALRNHILNNEKFDLEYRVKHANGSYVWVHCYAQSDRNSKGWVTRMAGLITDITQRKNTELALMTKERELKKMVSDLEMSQEMLSEQAEIMRNLAEENQLERKKSDLANEAKSRFLAVMSHELRTPMTGVIGMLDLLKWTELSHEQKDYVATLQNSAEALLQILNDILDYSKIESGSFTLENIAFDLNKISKDVIDLFKGKAEEKGIHLYSQIESHCATRLYGDPTRLRQVIMNLLGNAIKFTDYGEISLTIRDKGTIENQQLLRIEVSDTGIGIAKEQQKKLFRAFQQADLTTTRKYGGSGLGLVISKNIIEAMGGEIGLISQEGKGTTFWIEVTFEMQDALQGKEVNQLGHDLLFGDQAMLEKTISARGRNIKNPLRILVAEDNPVNRMLISKVIQKLGHESAIAENGQEALDIIMQDKSFDLILMDMQMPIMDGKTATKLIRKKGFLDLKIYALTADAMPEHREEYMSCGLDGLLTKPINITELDSLFFELSQEKEQNSDTLNPQPTDLDRLCYVQISDNSLERKPANNVPLINNEKVRNLQSAVGHEAFDEIIHAMPQETKRYVELLTTAYHSRDLNEIATAAHCLKGMAGSFGADRICALARTIENDLLNEKKLDKGLIQALYPAYEQTQTSMRENGY